MSAGQWSWRPPVAGTNSTTRMKGFSIPKSVRFSPLIKQPRRDDAEEIHLDAVRPKAPSFSISKHGGGHGDIAPDNGVPGIGAYENAGTLVFKSKRSMCTRIAKKNELPRLLDNTSQFPSSKLPLPTTEIDPCKGMRIGNHIPGGKIHAPSIPRVKPKGKPVVAASNEGGGSNPYGSAAGSPGPGFYNLSYTFNNSGIGAGGGVTIGKEPRMAVKEVASYHTLKAKAHTPGPGEYNVHGTDTTLSMKAATLLSSKYPVYEHPETENPDYVFLTSMRAYTSQS
eukprot:PhF_6_TR32354/c0_g1_i2/m.47980